MAEPGGDQLAVLRPGCEPGERISGYWVEIWCPNCGGDLAHEATGTPGNNTRAIARCVDCRRPWQVKVTLLSERGNIAKPGAAAAARRKTAKRAYDQQRDWTAPQRGRSA